MRRPTPVMRRQNPPPRRCAPPLLHEEGKASDFALLVEEGTTRQCRGGVVTRRQNQSWVGQTRPPRRCAPPLLLEEGKLLALPSCSRKERREHVAGGWSLAANAS